MLGDSCVETESAPTVVQPVLAVWRKVLESDAQSVGLTNTLNAAMSCHSCTKQNVALQMLEDHA